jgi:hypothetical protein
MAIVSSKSDASGLGYFCQCDCEDFAYRSQREQAMTQVEINSRWDRARDKLHVSGIWANGDLWGVKVSGGKETHDMWVSKGEGDAGPNFVCAHCLCALRLILKEVEGLNVLAFGCPDTDVPDWGETVSVDGWMVTLIEKRKKKDEN